MNMQMIESVGLILGGLTIFIYGINMMSDALKSIAGVKIREYIEKYTRNLFLSILVGTIISALLHSSSAVTVISISLVRAGLMGLNQAIGITIGANIGTCVTSIMIGLNIEQFAYYFVFIGILLMLLSHRKTMNYVGKVIAGFGFIFVGLEMMSDQLILIASQQWFMNILLALSKHPWWALFGGTVATGIMQSSTAVIGIVQKLYVTGSLTANAGAAFIFGANVGTCVTAMMAAIGGSLATKRAALFHVVYNILGALLAMVLLSPFIQLTNWVNSIIAGGGEMYIAQVHFLFNFISTLLVIPFVSLCVRLLMIIMPGDESHHVKIENIDQLDDSLIEKFPVAALAVAHKNTMRMGRNVLAQIDLSLQYLQSRHNEDYDECIEIEALINKYDSSLSEYLLKIARQPTLSKEQIDEYYKTYQVIKYLESIGDEINDILEFYHFVYQEKGTFSTLALQDLDHVYHHVSEMLNHAMIIYDKRDQHILTQLNKMEEELNTLEHLCRQNHFNRMKDHICDNTLAASVILDIFSHLETVGDLSLNIANSSFIPYYNHQDKYIDPQHI